MARGHRRLKSIRQNYEGKTRRQFAVAAADAAAFQVRSRAVRTLAWTGVAVSALTPTHALTLGEVAIESKLGQPLSATIPIHLGQGELLGANCVSVPIARPAELTNVPAPVLTVPETAIPGTYDLRVTTTRALYEPMYELQVQVRCVGTALLVRQYVLMLDLPGAEPMTAAPVVVRPDNTVPVTSSPREGVSDPDTRVTARPPHPRAPVKLGPPIAPGSRYRVVAGDTLSTIAARISDRGGRGIWQTADEIFATNPDAFIGGNQDLIALDSEIAIPATGSAPVAASDAVRRPEVPQASAPVQVAASQAVTPAAETAVVVATDAEPATSDAATRADRPRVRQPGTTAVATQAKRPVADVPEAASVERAAPEVSARAAADESLPGWLAMVVGLLIGMGASLALLRERLVGALRGLLVRQTAGVAPAELVEQAPVEAAPTRKAMPPREPSMVVVEERRDDADDAEEAAVTVVASAPRAFADKGLDTDLSSLFGTDAEGLDAVLSPPTGKLELDLDLSAAGSEATVDQDIGWLGDETALSPTDKSRSVPVPEGDDVDLQTLSQKAIDDEQLSQTLQDALNLLESDYEEELTASQVIDRSRFRAALESDDRDDTAIRTGTDNKRIR